MTKKKRDKNVIIIMIIKRVLAYAVPGFHPILVDNHGRFFFFFLNFL